MAHECQTKEKFTIKVICHPETQFPFWFQNIVYGVSNMRLRPYQLYSITFSKQNYKCFFFLSKRSIKFLTEAKLFLPGFNKLLSVSLKSLFFSNPILFSKFFLCFFFNQLKINSPNLSIFRSGLSF